MQWGILCSNDWLSPAWAVDAHLLKPSGHLFNCQLWNHKRCQAAAALSPKLLPALSDTGNVFFPTWDLAGPASWIQVDAHGERERFISALNARTWLNRARASGSSNSGYRGVNFEPLAEKTDTNRYPLVISLGGYLQMLMWVCRPLDFESRMNSEYELLEAQYERVSLRSSLLQRPSRSVPSKEC